MRAQIDLQAWAVALLLSSAAPASALTDLPNAVRLSGVERPAIQVENMGPGGRGPGYASPPYRRSAPRSYPPPPQYPGYGWPGYGPPSRWTPGMAPPMPAQNPVPPGYWRTPRWGTGPGPSQMMPPGGGDIAADPD